MGKIGIRKNFRRFLTFLPRLLQSQLKDSNLYASVVADASWAFLFNLVGKGIRFLVNVLLGRLLGAEGAGLIFLAFSVTFLSSLFGRLGLERAVIRHGGEAFGRGDSEGARQLYWSALSIVGIFSFATALMVAAFSDTLAIRVFQEPSLATILPIMAPGIVLFSFQQVQSSFLRSTDRVGRAVFLHNVTTNGAYLLLLPAGYFLSGVEGAASSYILSLLITVAVGHFLATGIQGWCPGWPGNRTQHRSLLGTGLRLFPLGITGFGMTWSDTLLLGALDSSSSVGLYELAFQVSALVVLFQAAFNSSTAPKFASHYTQGETEKLRRTFRTHRWLVLVLTLPFLIALLSYPRILVLLYGEEFHAAQTAFRLLVVAQFLRVSVGPVGNFLAMTDHDTIARRTVVASLIINISLNILLIPPYGIEGAAIATGSSYAIQNLSQYYFVRGITKS